MNKDTLAICGLSVLVTLTAPVSSLGGDYQNFLLCRDGKAACDFAVLSQHEAELVGAAAARRKFQACVEESPMCDQAALTTDQKAELFAARKARAKARLALILESARNFSACAYQLPECNATLLTIDQKTKLDAYLAEQGNIHNNDRKSLTEAARVPERQVASVPAQGGEKLRKFGKGLLHVLGALADAYIDMKTEDLLPAPMIVDHGSSSTILTDATLLTPAVIESRIDGKFEGWTGETLFKLQNGQIWQQAHYSYRYKYAYSPKIVIYRSGSGYKMLVDGVTEHLFVRRLK